MKQLKCAIVISVGLLAVQAMADDKAVEALYNQSCIACHASGAANAPKTGDVAAWKPRLEKGMDALLASAKKGINAMPPMGMCTTCSDDDMKALIEYMTKSAK